MKRRLDSALVQRALALSTAVNRHLGDVDRRIEERAAAREVESPAAGARATEPPAYVPGMPLPTGYGLQVRGPQGESIVLPVCLPPGFELDSMMLCPEFLPRVEPAHPRRRATDGPPPKVPVGSRLDGVMNLVFGSDQSYSTSIETEQPPPAREVPPVAAAHPAHVAVPELR
jgi:hypothetical protein